MTGRRFNAANVRRVFRLANARDGSRLGEITKIFRYPVKGLSPEALQRVALSAGEGLPDDRRFALARPETEFNPSQPEWLPKTRFVMLARDEKIAQLQTRLEGPLARLSVEHNGQSILNASLLDVEERGLVEAFFGDFLANALSGRPRVVTAAGHSFTDASRKPNSNTYKYVSLVNLASIRALEEVVGSPVDPLRFRANIYFDGPPAWAELNWVGAEIFVGGAILKIVSPTVRCAATMVNPVTACRDIDVPRFLRTAFGHIHMGIYAEVVAAGLAALGDELRIRR